MSLTQILKDKLNIEKPNLISGFYIFLIAMPLSLGIAMASGFPPIAGLVTAVVGGVLVSWLGSAPLTIKGPAAGLIAVVLGSVTELGQGNLGAGYKKTLAVGVIAGIVQVIFALLRLGGLGQIIPPAVVHGMMAAIGIIIISKQVYVLLGISPVAKNPIALLTDLPSHLSETNLEIAFIGLVSLLIVFAFPYVKNKWIQKIPVPVWVLACAVPLGFYFDLQHEHSLLLFHNEYVVGPKFLLNIPENIFQTLAFPDFSSITSSVSLKYILMFSLIGSIESTLTVIGIHRLKPVAPTPGINKDLFALGMGNLCAALAGGLPMISEVVRSRANVSMNATSARSNFYHGLFILLCVLFFPFVLRVLPLAALAALLVSVGLRLTSYREWVHVYRIGPEQLAMFATTCFVTLATDLLIGVASGVLLKFLLHFRHWASLKGYFLPEITTTVRSQEAIVSLQDSAHFLAIPRLKKKLQGLPPEIKKVTLDLSATTLVDHTFLSQVDEFSSCVQGAAVHVVGLDTHRSMSNHAHATRLRSPNAVAVSKG